MSPRSFASAVRRRIEEALGKAQPSVSDAQLADSMPAPTYSDETDDNIAWNRWRWGDKDVWKDRDHFGYRWDAQTPQQNSGPNNLIERFLVPHLRGHRNLKILEIGCGAGRISAELVRLSTDLYLVDLNQACTEICRRRFRYYPSVHVLQNDGRTLDQVPATGFDLIVAADTFIHVAPDIVRSYMREATARLNNGGILWIDHSAHGGDAQRNRSDLDLDKIQTAAHDLELTVEAQYVQGTDAISVLRRGERPSIVDDEAALRTDLRIVDQVLQRELTGTGAWNESRIPAIRSTFIRILRNLPLPSSSSTDLPVLEIGADGQLASSKVLATLTGLPVLASNFTISGMEDRIGSYPIQLHDASQGLANLPTDGISMIFGRSVLEHITGLDDFLADCARVLAPGGILFLDGGAFYFSPSGHHMSLHSPEGVHYGFDVMPELIPPWHHLQVDEAGLAQFLEDERGLSVADAQLISEYVYNSPEQNRLTASQIIDCFERVQFPSVKYECTLVDDQPTPELIAAHGLFNLTCHGLAFYVRTSE